MLRLINSKHSAAWKLDVSEPSPGQLFDASLENNSFSLEAFHCRLEVVAHQVELVPVFVGGMKGNLCRGQAEDQPAATRIDRAEPEDVIEELAIRIDIAAVHDHVSSADHGAQSKEETDCERELGVAWSVNIGLTSERMFATLSSCWGKGEHPSLTCRSRCVNSLLVPSTATWISLSIDQLSMRSTATLAPKRAMPRSPRSEE